MKRICTYNLERPNTREEINILMDNISVNIQRQVNDILREARIKHLVTIYWNNEYDKEENPDLINGGFQVKSMEKA